MTMIRQRVEADAPTRPGRSGRLVSRWVALRATWRRRLAFRRELRRLLETDVHLLADIGLSEKRAREEAEKPFWVE